MVTSAAEDLDVVVIGGGPAGSIAAHTLGQSGLNVILIERGAPHRDKACGDLFLPSAISVLADYGFDRQALLQAGGGEYRAIDLLGAGGRLLWRVGYPDESLWMLPRRRIDQALRDALPRNVRVVYQEIATKVELGNGERWDIQARNCDGEIRLFRCRAAVVACGAHPLPKTLDISGEPLVAPAISAYVAGRSLDAPAFEFSPDCRPGYAWRFPLNPETWNIGICSLTPARGSRLHKLGRALIQRCNLTPDVGWRGGAGPLWSGRGSQWHHAGGIVSCGDAAGLIDPYTGEGLTAAVTSGQAAGNAIVRFLKGNRDLSALSAYSHWVKQNFQEAFATSPIRTAWKYLCG